MTKIEQKIPEGWSVKTLGELGDIVSGGTPDTENSTFWDGDVYWLTPSEVTKLPTKYVYQTERTITKEGLKNSSAKLLPKNSLIICTRATVGDCCINAVPISTNQGFKNIILYEGDNIIYLYYLIVNNKFQFIRKACGSTFLEISKKDVSNLKFLLPPLPEQEKIAEILSCWDDGIEKLSALIEKKKIQKKALMQQLLTGKHRLKGFSSPWHEVKLGELLINISERNKELKILQVLSITNSKGFILPEEQFSRNVASEDLSNYKIVRQGDFAYNPSRINVGSIDQLNNFENGLLSPMYVVFRCNGKLLDLYMKHFIKSSEFIEKINCSAQGSVRETVDFKTLTSIKIKIPSDIAEQKAMAKILSKADEEIVLLNKKLEAFKLEKKALMQQLLTGKIRVKVN